MFLMLFTTQKLKAIFLLLSDLFLYIWVCLVYTGSSDKFDLLFIIETELICDPENNSFSIQIQNMLDIYTVSVLTIKNLMAFSVF